MYFQYFKTNDSFILAKFWLFVGVLCHKIRVFAILGKQKCGKNYVGAKDFFSVLPWWILYVKQLFYRVSLKERAFLLFWSRKSKNVVKILKISKENTIVTNWNTPNIRHFILVFALCKRFFLKMTPYIHPIINEFKLGIKAF